MHAVHKGIYDWFEISYDNFSRTSLPVHHGPTQDFFLTLYEKGFITAGILTCPTVRDDQLLLADRYVQGTCPVCGYEFARGDQCENCGDAARAFAAHQPQVQDRRQHACLPRQRDLFLELQTRAGSRRG